MEVYAEQTEPLLARYGESNRLVTVDGAGAVADVAGRVVTGINDGLAR